MFRVINRFGFVEPQLASPVGQPPEGQHWIHEIKHDGYRCQVLLDRGQARVFTRNGHDWSDRYPSIARATANLRCQSAIIDGEAIVQNSDGVSDRPTSPFGFAPLARRRTAGRASLRSTSSFWRRCSLRGSFASHSFTVQIAFGEGIEPFVSRLFLFEI